MSRLLQYIRFERLMERRKQKEVLRIMLKPFLDLFMEKDQKVVFRWAWLLLRFPNVFNVVFFTLAYCFLIGKYGSVEGIFFSGVVGILHTFYLVNHRFDREKILNLQSELNFLLRLNFVGKNKFILQKLFYEITKECLYLSVLPLILTAVMLTFIVPSAGWWLWLNTFLFASISFLFAFQILQSRLRHHKQRHKQLLAFAPLFITFFVFLSLPDYAKFIQTSPLDFRGFAAESISGRQWTMTGLTGLLLLYMVVCTVPYLRGKYNLQPFKNVEDGADFTIKGHSAYQKLLLKSMLYRGRLNKFRLGILMLTLIVVLLYPWLSKHPYISSSAVFVLFCYTPYLLYFLLPHYLYENLIEKRNLYTTYYLQKRYSFRKYALPLAFRTTVEKTAPFVVLPMLLLIALYHFVDAFMWLGLLCYLVSYLFVVRIIVFRMYQLEKYAIEQFAALNSRVITSNIADHLLLFGLPIVLAGPLLTLYIVKEWPLLLYFGFIGLAVYMGLYSLLVKWRDGSC